MLPDLDCMVLNLERERKIAEKEQVEEAGGIVGVVGSEQHKFLDLLEYIVDYENNVLYSQNKLANVWNKKWTLERSKTNDRNRCQKSQ